MARSHRPLWLLALLLLLGAGGGIWWWRAHRAKSTTEAKSDDKAGAGKDRGQRPSWASDPDAPPGAIEGIVLDPNGKPHDGALVHEMRRRGARRGLASMCIGVGQGITGLFELL